MVTYCDVRQLITLSLYGSSLVQQRLVPMVRTLPIHVQALRFELMVGFIVALNFLTMAAELFGGKWSQELKSPGQLPSTEHQILQ